MIRFHPDLADRSPFQIVADQRKAVSTVESETAVGRNFHVSGEIRRRMERQQREGQEHDVQKKGLALHFCSGIYFCFRFHFSL